MAYQSCVCFIFANVRPGIFAAKKEKKKIIVGVLVFFLQKLLQIKNICVIIP